MSFSVYRNVMPALRGDHRRLLLRGGSLAAAALVLIALGPIDAAAQSAEGSCAVNRVTYRAETNGGATTSSTTFVGIADAVVNITVAGADPTCLIVVFTAQTQTTDDENMVVRARIAGIGIGIPAEFATGPGTGTTEARPAQFVFEDVPPGDYIVRIQFRSVTGTAVTLSRPTVVVHHR